MDGFPEAAITQFTSLPMGEQYNKRELFKRWVKLFKVAASSGRPMKQMPPRWLQWAELLWYEGRPHTNAAWSDTLMRSKFNVLWDELTQLKGTK